MGGYAFNTGGNSPLMLDPMAEMQQASAQAKQSKLARLLGTAANAGAGADYSQANMIDPVATQGFQQRQSGLQDDKFKSFTQKASMAAAAWKAGNQQLAQGIYATLVPEAHAIAPGFDLPPQMDDSAAQAFEQMQQGSGGMVQSTFVDAQGNRVGIMRDGRTQVLGQNAPNNQIIDTGNGFFGVNKGNLQAAPVMTGDQAQPPAQPPQTTMAATGPKDQNAIMAQAHAMSEQGVPDDQVMAWYTQQMGAAEVLGGGQQGGGGAMQPPKGQQLRSVPKPQAPSALQEKIATARSMNVPEDQIRQMVVGGSQEAEALDLSPAAIDNAATRYNVTGIMPPLGMGKAAAAQRTQILTRAAELASGQSATDLATQPATYKNSQATLKGLQVSSAAMSRATNTLHSNADLLLSASQKVLGSSFTGTRLENEARLAYGRQTNDPDVAAFDQYAQTVANEYAKIIGGAPGSNAAATEGARADAERAIHKASSPAALKATITSLYKEAANIRNANDAEIARIRSGLSGQAPAQGGNKTLRFNPATGKIE